MTVLSTVLIELGVLLPYPENLKVSPFFYDCIEVKIGFAVVGPGVLSFAWRTGEPLGVGRAVFGAGIGTKVSWVLVWEPGGIDMDSTILASPGQGWAAAG